MTWLGWLALAGAIGAVSLPAPVTVRTGELAGRGRLGGRPVGSHLRGVGAVSWPAVSGIGGAVATVAAAIRFGPLIAVAVAAVLAIAGLLGRDLARRRRDDARRADLASALSVLVGELESGSQPTTALAAAAGAGPLVASTLLDAAAAARRGGDAATVLTVADDPDLVVLGAAWRLGESTGAALAEVLARVGADFAARDDQRRTVTTTLAGPRSSATLLSGLPALGIALGTAMGARPLPYLMTAPSGRALCCVGVLFDVAGVLWMRRIVRRAQRS